jgi:hypothetical protein
MRFRVLGFALILMLMTTAGAYAQRGRGNAQPPRPTPRYPDGRVSFAPSPGDLGVWLPGDGGAETLVAPDMDNPAFANFRGQPFPGKKKLSEVPFQPWAKELHEYRAANQFEPHTRCKPSGGVRQFITPYGVEFVDRPELKRVYIMDIGGPHTFRIIYMDRTTHPKDMAPQYYGDSIGHWEGDTLVVDTVGFNEKFWLDRFGLPTTEKLHLIEKFARINYTTMTYEVTVDDPGAYTSTWSTGFFLRWDQGQELFEYVCQDNNFAPELMLGAQKSVDRSSPIVP